jgi:hypothetical protein
VINAMQELFELYYVGTIDLERKGVRYVNAETQARYEGFRDGHTVAVIQDMAERDGV